MATKIRTVNGFAMDGKSMEPCKVTARTTVDKKGKTLSLENGKTMIIVAVEQLKGMVDIK